MSSADAADAGTSIPGSRVTSLLPPSSLFRTLRTKDPDAAFVILDKALRSPSIGDQVEALTFFADLIRRSPLSNTINTVFIRLSEYFRVASNKARLLVLSTFKNCQQYMDKVTSSALISKHVSAVLSSNDVLARAITLRLLATMAVILKDSYDLHHEVLKSLVASDSSEVLAAIDCVYSMSSRSSQMAQACLPRVTEMVQNSMVPQEFRLRLIRIFENFHYDRSMSNTARDVLTAAMAQHPNRKFVLSGMDALTRLSCRHVLMVPEQISLLREYAESDARPAVQRVALKCITRLAQQTPCNEYASPKHYLAVARVSAHDEVRLAALDIVWHLVNQSASQDMSIDDVIFCEHLLTRLDSQTADMSADILVCVVLRFADAAGHLPLTIEEQSFEMNENADDGMDVDTEEPLREALASRLVGALFNLIRGAGKHLVHLAARFRAHGNDVCETFTSEIEAALEKNQVLVCQELALLIDGASRLIPAALVPCTKRLCGILERAYKADISTKALVSLSYAIARGAQMDGIGAPGPVDAEKFFFPRLSTWVASNPWLMYKVGCRLMAVGQYGVSHLCFDGVKSLCQTEQSSAWIESLVKVTHAEASLLKEGSAAATNALFGIRSAVLDLSSSGLNRDFQTRFWNARVMFLEGILHVKQILLALPTSGERTAEQLDNISVMARGDEACYQELAARYKRLARHSLDVDPHTRTVLEGCEVACLFMAYALSVLLSPLGQVKMEQRSPSKRPPAFLVALLESYRTQRSLGGVTILETPMHTLCGELLEGLVEVQAGDLAAGNMEYMQEIVTALLKCPMHAPKMLHDTWLPTTVKLVTNSITRAGPGSVLNVSGYLCRSQVYGKCGRAMARKIIVGVTRVTDKHGCRLKESSQWGDGEDRVDQGWAKVAERQVTCGLRGDSFSTSVAVSHMHEGESLLVVAYIEDSRGRLFEGGRLLL